jgi:hypothetical protein
LERAALRQCLQSQIEGLNEVLTTNSSFGFGQKAQLLAALGRIGQDVTVKLDHMEQAVRELLQIVGLPETSPPNTNIKESGTCLGFHK